MCLRTFRDFGGGSLYNDSFGFLDQNPHNTMHIWTGGMNPEYQPAPEPEPRRRPRTREQPQPRCAGGRPQLPPARGSLHAAAVRRHVQQPHRVVRSGLLADPRQHRPALVGVAAGPSAVAAGRSRFGAHAVELHDRATRSTCPVSATSTSKCTYIIPVGLADAGRPLRLEADRIPRRRASAFRSAEVRLHRVPQLPRSCFIRVFLNLPDANAARRSIEDPHYAGYLGDLRPRRLLSAGRAIASCRRAQPRKYDLRPRSHNTPRNHRINVTQARAAAARRRRAVACRSRWWSSAPTTARTTSCCGSTASRSNFLD